MQDTTNFLKTVKQIVKQLTGINENYKQAQALFSTVSKDI
jgi:hypothetical protein